MVCLPVLLFVKYISGNNKRTSQPDQTVLTVVSGVIMP